MNLPELDKTWETFLRVPPAATADVAPAADEAWMLARGILPDAPRVLEALTRHVLPTIDRLRQEEELFPWWCFLVHDGASGVPTTPEDKSLYVHLRFQLRPLVFVPEPAMAQLEEGQARDWFPPPWEMTRRQPLSREIAGLDLKALTPRATEEGAGLGEIAVQTAWWLLGAQSEWLLDLLRIHRATSDPLTVLRHVRQYLHFFANMTQMRVA